MMRAMSEFFGLSPSGGGKFLPYVLAQSAVAVSAPIDTNEDTLATITVPANALGANGRLRINALFSATNNANSKTMRIRYSGIGGTAFISLIISSQLSLEISTLNIVNRGATNSQVGNSNWAITGTGTVPTSGVAPITAAVDTTVATTLVITGQKATGTDTLTLESYLVELLYAT